MFADGLARGSGAVQANAALVRKVAFPHRLLVYANVASTFAVHLLGYAVVLVVLRLMGEPIALSRLPIALALVGFLFLATVGIAACLAAMQVLVRDIGQLLGVVLTLIFYATPVLYPVALVPERVQPWLLLNPLTPVLERLRELLLGGAGFAVIDVVIAAVSIAIFAAGAWVFERLSPFFEDFL
jgi:ABC-type polysaccharide/polyol phosphate export permease